MKFKKIDKNYCITICDKITRLQPANIRYKLLIDNILAKYYLDTDIKALSDNIKLEYAFDIINQSFTPNSDDEYFAELFKLIESEFYNYNELSYQYLSFRFNLTEILNSFEITPKTKNNIAWLKKIQKEKPRLVIDNKINPNILPVKKILLCEGQTEYILLEELFRLFNYDFSEFGIHIIPAGGKNKVIRMYYDLVEYCKIPIFILLDNDAIPLKEQLYGKLRDKDRLYIVKSGEFEDLIPINVIKNTINYIHENEYNCISEDFSDDVGMVHTIEKINKKYGFGEFKKAHFAKFLREYIVLNTKKEDFLQSEISEIINAFISF